MTQFIETKERHFKTLELYVPVVARVHGNSHPEFHKVKELFEQIEAKTAQAGSAKPDLAREFASLRQITNNYTTPHDVCESYQAVYTMLSELDKAYQALRLADHL